MRHPLAIAPLPAALAAAALALLPAAAGAAPGHVGPETCKACHPAAYASWREGPHARALETLPERSRSDARCLGCHSPAAEAGLSGVTCEACHGPGRLYAARYVMRDRELARAVGLVDPGEKTCLGCHTESTPSLRRFDVKRKLELIAHPDRAGAPARPLPPAKPPSTPPAKPAR